MRTRTNKLSRIDDGFQSRHAFRKFTFSAPPAFLRSSRRRPIKSHLYGRFLLPRDCGSRSMHKYPGETSTRGWARDFGANNVCLAAPFYIPGVARGPIKPGPKLPGSRSALRRLPLIKQLTYSSFLRVTETWNTFGSAHRCKSMKCPHKTAMLAVHQNILRSGAVAGQFSWRKRLAITVKYDLRYWAASQTISCKLTGAKQSQKCKAIYNYQYKNNVAWREKEKERERQRCNGFSR